MKEFSLLLKIPVFIHKSDFLVRQSDFFLFLNLKSYIKIFLKLFFLKLFFSENKIV